MNGSFHACSDANLGSPASATLPDEMPVFADLADVVQFTRALFLLMNAEPPRAACLADGTATTVLADAAPSAVPALVALTHVQADAAVSKHLLKDTSPTSTRSGF